MKTEASRREYIKRVVLERKEKYLSENKEYRKKEALFHRHIAGKYIGDLVYGANDGIITTFAIIAGASGASFPPIVVVILGLSNILADGISMGASNFLGKKSEQDYAKAQREKEAWEIEHLKELEEEEIREIFEKKGFTGKDLEKAVKIITSNKDIWIDTMMKEELGITIEDKDDPKKHGLATFVAFTAAGFFPLLSYLIPGTNNHFLISSIVSGFTLFIVGALRTLITTVSFIRGGLEMLIVGSLAASVAYLVGALLEKLLQTMF